MSDKKLDKLAEDITELKITMERNTLVLERNTDSLELHMKRTELLEQDMKIVKNHVTFVKGSFYALGVVGTLIYVAFEMGILSKLF